ncbi:hypothetical protein [Roseibium suaedae]|uniref:hypothetical protein n=1 Tax=Roseibium suaedae TaxID=735517 RepID=UPI0009346C45|nr:hypothetical protein [Roseibium suaedae]
MIFRIFAALALVALGACASADPLPSFASGPAPDDPSLGLGSASFAGSPVDYSHREPVDPRSWRQMNDEQAPASGGRS